MQCTNPPSHSGIWSTRRRHALLPHLPCPCRPHLPRPCRSHLTYLSLPHLPCSSGMDRGILQLSLELPTLNASSSHLASSHLTSTSTTPSFRSFSNTNGPRSIQPNVLAHTFSTHSSTNTCQRGRWMVRNGQHSQRSNDGPTRSKSSTWKCCLCRSMKSCTGLLPSF